MCLEGRKRVCVMLMCVCECESGESGERVGVRACVSEIGGVGKETV